MQEDTEAAPRAKRRPTKLFIIVLIILICAAGFGILYLQSKQDVTPFPSSIADGLNYAVYYPSAPVNGFTYKKGTANVQAGILFFTLANGTKKVLVTEQAAPKSKINLKSLPKLTPLQLPIGQAVIGTGLGNPSIVIMTQSTLIQLSSNKGVTKTDVTNVAQKLTRQN